MIYQRNLQKWFDKIRIVAIVVIAPVIILTSLLRFACQWIPQFKARCFWQAIFWLPGPGEPQTLTDAVLAITVFAIYLAWRQLRASRTAQNLSTLSHLNELYANDTITAIRSSLFAGRPVSLSEVSKCCSLLDTVGHIVFQLPDDDREIACEQWSETFMRCWIILREFVYAKRPVSIGRDYVYFEWLASRCRESMIKRFS